MDEIAIDMLNAGYATEADLLEFAKAHRIGFQPTNNGTWALVHQITEPDFIEELRLLGQRWPFGWLSPQHALRAAMVAWQRWQRRGQEQAKREV